MIERKYERLNETVAHGVLDNGLHIYVDRRPGFGKCFAFFATHYGGMDMRFTLDGQWQDTPAGVAHFLEHKLFDTKDGNALQEMASNGASPNAFTSSALTGYYFECTEAFEKNLKTLLSFVSVPYFTKESVAKEQGIIGQEIRMGDDDPDLEVFLNLMDCLYTHHPIRERIAGSEESIAGITDETLYACHKAFYNPGNMVLTVVGDVDPQMVFDVASAIVTAPNQTQSQRDYGKPEPVAVAKAKVEKRMEVATPLFQLGFKADPIDQGEGKLRTQLMGDLCSEVVFGDSSPLYAKLYGQGLITRDFGCGYEDYPGCAFLCAGGESHSPQAVAQAVTEEVARLTQEGIDPDFFRRLKRAAYGSWVRSLNSFENLAVELAQSHFDGTDYLTFPAVFDSITEKDVEACIARWMTPERMALSTVVPGGEEA